MSGSKRWEPRRTGWLTSAAFPQSERAGGRGEPAGWGLQDLLHSPAAQPGLITAAWCNHAPPGHAPACCTCSPRTPRTARCPQPPSWPRQPLPPLSLPAGRCRASAPPISPPMERWETRCKTWGLCESSWTAATTLVVVVGGWGEGGPACSHCVAPAHPLTCVPACSLALLSCCTCCSWDSSLSGREVAPAAPMTDAFPFTCLKDGECDGWNQLCLW